MFFKALYIPVKTLYNPLKAHNPLIGFKAKLFQNQIWRFVDQIGGFQTFPAGYT